jgi:hypothetical protein
MTYCCAIIKPVCPVHSYATSYCLYVMLGIFLLHLQLLGVGGSQLFKVIEWGKKAQKYHSRQLVIKVRNVNSLMCSKIYRK